METSRERWSEEGEKGGRKERKDESRSEIRWKEAVRSRWKEGIKPLFIEIRLELAIESQNSFSQKTRAKGV